MTGRIRPARLLIAPIRFYQRYVSPSLPATCRYYPTCSAYAVEALQVHGVVRGSWLTLRRLGRCQPWSRHDHHDPVPPARSRHASTTSTTGLREPDGPLGSSPSGSQTTVSTPVGSSHA